MTMQYDQNMVLLSNLSNASPDAACVIYAKQNKTKPKTKTFNGRTCASVKAGGEEMKRTFDMTNIGLIGAISFAGKRLILNALTRQK